MDKINVREIEQSSLSGVEKIAELQARTTNKVDELVEGYNKIMKIIDKCKNIDKKIDEWIDK